MLSSRRRGLRSAVRGERSFAFYRRAGGDEAFSSRPFMSASELRSCIHNRGIPEGRGIFRPARHKNAVQPLWLTSFCNAAEREKTCSGGVRGDSERALRYCVAAGRTIKTVKAVKTVKAIKIVKAVKTIQKSFTWPSPSKDSLPEEAVRPGSPSGGKPGKSLSSLLYHISGGSLCLSFPVRVSCQERFRSPKRPMRF